MTDSEAILILEAVLLCANEPLSTNELSKLFFNQPINSVLLQKWLIQLQDLWADRGLNLVQLEKGWRFQSCSSMQCYIDQLHFEKPPKYSRAVIETLATIAWRQPVTRGDIEEIRKVSLSPSIIKTLQEREWIEAVGYRNAPGRPALFGTTSKFLEDFSLRSLAELPKLTHNLPIDISSKLNSEEKSDAFFLNSVESLPSQSERDEQASF